MQARRLVCWVPVQLINIASCLCNMDVFPSYGNAALYFCSQSFLLPKLDCRGGLDAAQLLNTATRGGLRQDKRR